MHTAVQIMMTFSFIRLEVISSGPLLDPNCVCTPHSNLLHTEEFHFLVKMLSWKLKSLSDCCGAAAVSEQQLCFQCLHCTEQIQSSSWMHFVTSTWTGYYIVGWAWKVSGFVSCLQVVVFFQLHQTINSNIDQKSSNQKIPSPGLGLLLKKKAFPEDVPYITDREVITGTTRCLGDSSQLAS